ncbi:CB1 cannabinoid receptor-interacting protein 1-like [Littorina saxatilis]|uniref:CB1 cannabinoid receptor-interacting protein 1 n=1 Tax=Littorina saxatilis TaxID=31220 RepID=A0AAN9BH68_9CAEN
MARWVEALLEIKAASGQLVTFRREGARFSQDFTVKLCVDQTYNLTLRLEPACKLIAWRIGGQDSLTFKPADHKTKGGHSHTDSADYTAAWSTQEYRITSPGQRHDLVMDLELEGGKLVRTSTQVKFYDQKMAASRLGKPVHAITFTCDVSPGQPCVTARRGSIL